MSYPGHLLERGSYPSTEKKCVYSTTPADWATRWWSLIPLQRFIIYMSMSILRLFSVISRTLVVEGVTPLQRCSVCTQQLQPIGQLVGGVLFLFRDSLYTWAWVSSDCLVSYPGHSLERGSYPSTEMQSVYSTTPANWATRWWSLIPLHRFIIYMSMCIVCIYVIGIKINFRVVNFTQFSSWIAHKFLPKNREFIYKIPKRQKNTNWQKKCMKFNYFFTYPNNQRVHIK